MKQLLFLVFTVTAFSLKSQCSLTSSVTPESCPGACDASVTFSLSSGCTAFPYKMVISGTCSPTGTVMLTSSVTTFTGLCSCTGLNACILYNSLNLPISFSNFTTFGGIPLTVFSSSVQASCSSCCDGSITAFVTGGTAPYTYTWSGPAVSANTSSITNICPGVYTLCAMDSKGCVSCSAYTLGFSTGISGYNNGELKIINSDEEFIFLGAENFHSMKVYDLTGRLVHHLDGISSNKIHLYKGILQKGIYVVGLEGTRHMSKQKIVVN